MVRFLLIVLLQPRDTVCDKKDFSILLSLISTEFWVFFDDIAPQEQAIYNLYSLLSTSYEGDEIEIVHPINDLPKSVLNYQISS